MLLECNYQSTKFLSQKAPEKQFDQNPTCIRTKKRKTKPTSLPENPPSTSEEASDAELSPSVAAEMPGVFCPRPSDNTHTHTHKSIGSLAFRQQQQQHIPPAPSAPAGVLRDR
jgi:hypothetical protein